MPCIGVLAIALLMGPVASANSLPEGFRYPNEADRTGDWKDFRKEVPTPFRAQADFNGDGLIDDVWLLLRTSNKGWGLFVFLSHKTTSPTVIKLEEDDGQTAAQRLGVEVVQTGEYETACGKGYWKCEPGEPTRLKLLLPAIDFFTFESANSYYWWDVRSKKFARTWISD